MTSDDSIDQAAATAIERLRSLVGRRLGPSDWLLVDQDRIDSFTRATDDPQWIHIDPVRAAAGPFGTTIAQGYLTMSLMVPLTATIPLHLDPPPTMAINYGLDRLRFPSPVPAGARVRAWVEVKEVREVPGGAQIVRLVTIEVEHSDKPAVVAESVTRLLWS
jgi:acyl dehydratase